ncbi:MAG: ABC transporter permease [Thaumarchaeota archaeon]|nr:ABC transporter permease [Nitrososphaerota archaeon]
MAFVSGQNLSLSEPVAGPSGESWSIRNATTDLGSLSVAYSKTGSTGAILVSFQKTTSFSGTIGVSLVRSVEYSYPPPPRFRVPFNITLQKSSTVGYRFALSIINPNHTEYRIWDSVNKYSTIQNGGGGFSSSNLTAPSYTIDSYLVSPLTKTVWFGDSTANAAKRIFATHGTYEVKMGMAIRPGLASTEGAKFTLTGLQVKIDGDASGLLGTDQLGRDIFTQLVYGTRWALYVGVLSASLGVALGLAVGIVAGYIGGVLDEFLMRIADFVLVLPFLPFLIVLSVLLRPSITTITWIIAILGWPTIARIIRSIVIGLKSRAFVDAARASGASTGRILLRHMLPNVSPIAFTQLVLFIPGAIITLTAITFLGLGDATIVDWGYMTNAAFVHNFRAWWWILPPGILTALLSSGFLFVGYAMDSILNPRLRRR